MAINGFHHMAINVLDINASRVFYADVMGFEEQETIDMGEFSITYFAVPGSGRIELFDYRGNNEKTGRLESEAGLRHLAFAVDSVNAFAEKLSRFNVPVTLPVTDLPQLGVKVMLFLDPNGVTLEVCEKL